MARNAVFRQLFEPISSTYTYIIGCNATKRCVIIDPVLETSQRDARLVNELGLTPIYGLNTHVHADHVTGTGILKSKKFFPKMRSILSRNGGGKADILVSHGDIVDISDELNFEVRETPGHTNGCITFVFHHERIAFTGDALLIRGCGRTDFQQGIKFHFSAGDKNALGDSKRLYKSVHSQIFTLPADYLLYPAHDYTGRMASSVEEERKFNPRFIKAEDEFVLFMKNLQLAYPKQIDKSVPANLVCGIREEMDVTLQHKVFGNGNAA